MHQKRKPKGKNMIKKLLVTAIAAGAMTVPLAGAAWADPPTNPGSNGNGVGAGGTPGVNGGVNLGAVLGNAGTKPAGSLPEFFGIQPGQFWKGTTTPGSGHGVGPAAP
jgi:hypothetical protein